MDLINWTAICKQTDYLGYCLDSLQALRFMQVASCILIILGNVHWPVEISTAAENSAISSSVSCSEHKLLAKSNTALTKSSQPWRETERGGQRRADQKERFSLHLFRSCLRRWAKIPHSVFSFNFVAFSHFSFNFDWPFLSFMPSRIA